MGVEDDFFEAGGDSLLAAQMLLEAEKITRKLLRGRILPVPATIRLRAKGIADAPPLAEEALVTLIVRCALRYGFFYCHGDYMFGGRYAYKLADLLGDDHAFYLLNNYDLTDRQTVPSIEELARGYSPQCLLRSPLDLFVWVATATAD